MTSTGAKFPTSGTNQPGVGSKAWTSPGNIVAHDSANATITESVSSGSSNWLVGAAFDFSALNDSDIINGITVVVGVFTGGASSFDNNVQIWQSGGSVGTNKATSTTLVSGTTVTYGGSTDTWGLTLTGADVKDSGFGVGFGVHCGLHQQVWIDYITMSIDYSPGSATVTKDVTGSGKISQNHTKDVTGSGKVSHIRTADVGSGGHFSIVHTKDITGSGAISQVHTKSVTGSGEISHAHSKDVTGNGKISQAHTTDMALSAEFHSAGNAAVDASMLASVAPGLSATASGLINRTIHSDIATTVIITQSGAASTDGSALIQQAVSSDVDAGAQFEFARALVFASAVISHYGPLIPTIAIARISGRPTPAIARMKRPGG